MPSPPFRLELSKDHQALLRLGPGQTLDHIIGGRGFFKYQNLTTNDLGLKTGAQILGHQPVGSGHNAVTEMWMSFNPISQLLQLPQLRRRQVKLHKLAVAPVQRSQNFDGGQHIGVS